MTEASNVPSMDVGRLAVDVGAVLRRYGFVCKLENAYSAGAAGVRLVDKPAAVRFVIVEDVDHAAAAGLVGRDEPPLTCLYDDLRRRHPVYHAVLPYLSFDAAGLEPLLTTSDGRPVLAWRNAPTGRELVCGLRFVEELVRHTQGDPAQVELATVKSLWGYGHERAVYLYTPQLNNEIQREPWADNLGYLVAECLAEAAGAPLLAPLPDGADGGIMLTGDDDQAYLEKYDEQLALIGDFPITYLLLPQTRHTKETLAKFPSNVEIGLHVDALETPDKYDEICADQTRYVRELSGKPVVSVRNHGHLNRDYWGHLKAWETCDLHFDLNLPGMDAVVRTGSFLPFRVRRADGSWSGHYSLFSAFSDSMHFQLKLTEPEQCRIIYDLAHQIEASRPGVMVFNFHPQNVSLVIEVTKAIMAVGRRPNWVALGAESFSGWLRRWDHLRIEWADDRWTLDAPYRMERLALREFGPKGWVTRRLPEAEGRLALS